MWLAGNSANEAAWFRLLGSLKKSEKYLISAFFGFYLTMGISPDNTKSAKKIEAKFHFLHAAQWSGTYTSEHRGNPNGKTGSLRNVQSQVL